MNHYDPSFNYRRKQNPLNNCRLMKCEKNTQNNNNNKKTSHLLKSVGVMRKQATIPV